ncbi:ABC transporter ATP-binding protein [Pusillimonas sp. ANT_WB101]|uniref:ABC transporter ATP-binding protein n=1 Tax=Pusillimonas sp. ANT_WB101 TaxID=2597356 RepID=UPI0011ED064C|nr:ABC transporter ATP-binding protein [Pusillimonas sp. ANT_WB101]KAA0892898.1 ABC transporter ATP-binding protein [Pusillimonas sp. ANT_WB101]
MLLEIQGLEVHYGSVRALHGADLVLGDRPLAVVGRNGMGKTTLCHGIMGLAKVTAGTITLDGIPLQGLPPHRIAAHGIALVPQGRRLFQSLSVDEHLKLAQRGQGAWTRERIYDTFPRLAERRRNMGNELSGGEQQMVAIARALLANPRLIIMDEPTEGLAPLMVEQVIKVLQSLVHEGNALLLVEQNLGVALAVADEVAVMVNGVFERRLNANILREDPDLQQRLLGVATQA